MKKYFATWDFMFILLICLFGGLLDGFTFIYRDGTFCMIQTGNLIKSVVRFIDGNWREATYCLIIFFFFCLFLFLLYYLLIFLKSKNINYHNVTMPLIALFFIPSIIWKFNTNNYLSYQNIISGMFFSAIGAIFALSFKNVKFKTDKNIAFNAAMMTGNTRAMMVCFVEYLRTKNKEKLFQSFCYIIMILAFSVGVTITGLNYHFLTYGRWDVYAISIIIYLSIVVIIFILHHRYKWIKSMERKNNELIN